MNIEKAMHELKIQSQVLESMILYNKDFQPKNNNTYLESKKNAIDIGIKALEMQVPMKIKKRIQAVLIRCPKCNKPMADDRDIRFCCYCGQAIDWQGVK